MARAAIEDEAYLVDEALVPAVLALARLPAPARRLEAMAIRLCSRSERVGRG
jgi:hypothetical protein